MLIYLAGPYSGRDRTEIEFNILKATLVGQELMRRGHHVLCPHTMTDRWDEDTGLTYRDFMEQCLDLLRRCDAIYLLDGWRESSGAQREYDEALRRHMTVYYNMDEVPQI